MPMKPKISLQRREALCVFVGFAYLTNILDKNGGVIPQRLKFIYNRATKIMLMYEQWHSEMIKEVNDIVFDYPDKDIVRRGRTNPRMAALIDFTSQLGEVMQGGMNFKELSEELNKVGFYIKEYENPQVIQERYFENRDDELQAYENIAFMTAEKN